MNNKNYFLFGSFFFLAILLIFKNQQVAEGQNIVQPTYDAFVNTQVSNNLSVATTTPTIIYQIIERAVPGPQGPQGIVGPQGPMGPSGRDSSTIASFFPNTAVGGQYLGYGSGSSANPTGTGNLSALNVSGDSAFGGKITGAGLLSCNTLTSKILYNSTTGQFECGTDQGGSGFSGGDITVQNLFATTSLHTPVVYASTSNASTSNINTATITNLFVPNALLTFATLTSATATNIYSTNASISAATTTNFFSSILNSLTSTFINLLFTNATGTNATTTNFFTTNLNSLGNFVLGTGTIASTTITDANITNASVTTLHVENFSPNSISVNLATFTSGTSTNWFTQNSSSTNSNISNLIATNATFSYATVTSGFFTNLSVTGPVSAALSNGFVFRGATNNFSEATSTLFIADTGKIGIGSTTPSEKLSVQGNLLVSGNIVNPKLAGVPNSVDGGDVYLCMATTGEVVIDCSGNYSDIRLKKNIETVTGALEKVQQLNTVKYNWIDEKRGTTTQIGYIAQEVEKVIPEAIKTDSSGILKIKYDVLSSIYANAIKELFQKVLGIDSRVERLEARMNDLENKLNGQNSFNNQNQTPTTPVPDTPPVSQGDNPPEEQPGQSPETPILTPPNPANTPPETIEPTSPATE